MPTASTQSTVGVNVMQTTLYTYALNGIENFRPVQALNSRVITTYKTA